MTRSSARERASRRPDTEDEPPASAHPLTDRQLEVLLNAARGLTNRQIGEELGISELTVRNHMRDIGKRLSSSDRTHAVVIAIGNGWIPIPIEPAERPSQTAPGVARLPAGS